MKRDMSLIREILLAVEEWPIEGGDQHFAALERSEDDLTYNVTMAIESGLLHGVHAQSAEGHASSRVFGLTPEGHAFIDKARNQFIWDEVGEEIKKKGLASVSFDVLKGLLDRRIRKQLDLE